MNGSNTNDNNTNSNAKISNKEQARYGKNVQSPLRNERKAKICSERSRRIDSGQGRLVKFRMYNISI